MDKEQVVIFLAEFTQQFEQIISIYSTLERKTSKLPADHISAELVESIGYWLHNLYCAYEDLFKIVASFWENNIGINGAYHKNLLKRMMLQIPGIRPALLSEESFKALDELRAFRHVFRHAYSYGLDDERVIFLLKRVLKQKSVVLHDMEQFKVQIASLVDEYEVE